MRLDVNLPPAAFAEKSTRSHIHHALNTLLFDVHSKVGRRTNLMMTLIIIIGVLISMIGTLKSLEQVWVDRIYLIEQSITMLFVVEFFARCYAAKSIRAYLFSFYGIVDMLAVLPMLLVGTPNVAIRMLRIIRLLKMMRYMKALKRFMATMHDSLEILGMVLGGIALGAILGGNVIYELEPDVFESAFEGAWWSIVTMTTVGYGDVVPHTIAGRAIAICMMVVGVSMFAALTGVVSVKVAHFLHDEMQCQNCGKAIAPDYCYCPHCAAMQGNEEENEQIETSEPQK